MPTPGADFLRGSARGRERCAYSGRRTRHRRRENACGARASSGRRCRPTSCSPSLRPIIAAGGIIRGSKWKKAAKPKPATGPRPITGVCTRWSIARTRLGILDSLLHARRFQRIRKSRMGRRLQFRLARGRRSALEGGARRGRRYDRDRSVRGPREIHEDAARRPALNIKLFSRRIRGSRRRYRRERASRASSRARAGTRNDNRDR